MRAIIENGRVLRGGEISEGPLAWDSKGRIAADRSIVVAERIDAGGRLVLPGIVDIHGDAFERQLTPRAQVAFPPDIALMDNDRQLIANGITTAFYGVSVSWEPGLRSAETARGVVEALERLRPRMACDARLHLRWETFALEALDEVISWLDAEPKPILALNDHTTECMLKPPEDRRYAKMADRTGLTEAACRDLIERVWARGAEVPAAIERAAAAARAAGAVLLAHDEMTPEDRRRNRALGAVACEFPMTRETAEAARAAGEPVILGAPNVVRGGSHKALLDATAAVRDGLCAVLASDYYYPAPLHAAFLLAAQGAAPLAAAWELISRNPAEAAGLSDRGALERGRRADVIFVDDADPALPRVTDVFVAGRRVYSAA